MVKHIEHPSALFEIEQTPTAEEDDDEMNGFLEKYDLEKKYVVVVISASSIAQRYGVVARRQARFSSSKSLKLPSRLHQLPRNTRRHRRLCTSM